MNQCHSEAISLFFFFHTVWNDRRSSQRSGWDRDSCCHLTHTHTHTHKHRYSALCSHVSLAGSLIIIKASGRGKGLWDVQPFASYQCKRCLCCWPWAVPHNVFTALLFLWYLWWERASVITSACSHYGGVTSPARQSLWVLKDSSVFGTLSILAGVCRPHP